MSFYDYGDYMLCESQWYIRCLGCGKRTDYISFNTSYSDDFHDVVQPLYEALTPLVKNAIKEGWFYEGDKGICLCPECSQPYKDKIKDAKQKDQEERDLRAVQEILQRNPKLKDKI